MKNTLLLIAALFVGACASTSKIKPYAKDSHQNVSGKIYEKSAFKYDEKGNKVEVVWYDASGKLTEKSAFTHDKKGNEANKTKYELKTGFGERRFVPTGEETYEFTYWD